MKASDPKIQNEREKRLSGKLFSSDTSIRLDWKKIRIMGVSLVSIPTNAESLRQFAKSDDNPVFHLLFSIKILGENQISK